MQDFEMELETEESATINNIMEYGELHKYLQVYLCARGNDEFIITISINQQEQKVISISKLGSEILFMDGVDAEETTCVLCQERGKKSAHVEFSNFCHKCGRDLRTERK